MKTTLKTKNGIQTFDTEDGASAFPKSSPGYKAMEAYFEEWINEDADSETQEMYTGSFEELNGGSYLVMSGAIQDGLDALCEYIEENNLTYLTTKDFYKIDLEGVFQA